MARHLDKLTGDVLEVGSRNVNGSVRDLVPQAIGVDVEWGPNVDVVCTAEKLLEEFAPESFDAVLTLDAFEHMADWRACLTGMWAVLKRDGWLVMSMASPSKRYHGYPHDYWRADIEKVREIFPDAGDLWATGLSMGWVVQKKGELPHLAKIDLIPVS